MPSLDDLKTQVGVLNEYLENSVSGESFQSRLLRAYKEKICLSLLEILNGEESDLVTNLENFLKSNWALVKNTAFTYTAMPDDAVTKLLCNIAQFVVEKKKEANATDTSLVITTLMPGISLDSLDDTKGSNNLRLYPDLSDPTLDIFKILRTHILDHKGQSLLPIRLLTKTDVTTEAVHIDNPYYDYAIPGMDARLIDEEYERLESHSTLTQELIIAKRNYELNLNDKSNLLGHLRQLCFQLAFNSVYGTGTETNAGTGVYAAIQAFNAYYEALGDKKALIPAPVKAAIDLLLELASNPEVNINATANTQTCVAIRRNSIESAMQDHLEVLSTIGLLDDATRAQLLTQAKERFEAAKAALTTALDNDTYSEGHDALGLTVELCTALETPFAITSSRDLNTIREFTPSEIRRFMASEETQRQFIRQIDTIENMVIFSLHCSPAKLKTILEVTGALFFNQKIRTISDFIALTISLNEERCRIVFEVFKENIVHLARTGQALSQILYYLNPEQYGAILEILKDKLLPSSEYARDLLSALNPAQRAAALTALQDYFIARMDTPQNLNTLFASLTPEERTLFFTRIREQLPEKITNAQDFNKIFQYLPSEQASSLFSALGSKVPGLIKNIEDMQQVMQYLDPGQQIIVFNAIKADIPARINTATDFKNTLKYLPEEQRALLFESVLSRLPLLVNSSDALTDLLTYLTPAQSQLVIDSVKSNFPSLATNYLDVMALLGRLQPSERLTFLKSLEGKLPSIIKNYDAISYLLNVLNTEERKFVFAVLTPTLVDHINNFERLKALFLLKPEEVQALLPLLENKIPSLIINVEQLEEILTKPHAKGILSTSMQAALPSIIQNYYALKYVFQYIPIDQFPLVFKSMEKQIPTYIPDYRYFQDLFERADKTRCAAFISSIQESLPLVFKKLDDLISLFRFLQSDDKKKPIILSMKEHLPALVKDGMKLRALVCSFSESNCIAVLAAIKPQIAIIIKSTDDLENTLSNFSAASAQIIIEAMKDKLPTLITNTSELISFLGNIHGSLKISALTTMQDHLPRLITNINELKLLLTHLNPEQRTVVFASIKNELATLITKPKDLETLLPFLTASERTHPILQLTELVLNMNNHYICGKDVLLANYIREAKVRIATARTPEQYAALRTEFTHILTSISSPQVHDVKEYINSLRGGVTCMTIGKNKKAQHIEDALCALPLGDRGTVLSAPSNGVQEAMATYRFRGTVGTPSHFVELKEKYKTTDGGLEAPHPSTSSSGS